MSGLAPKLRTFVLSVGGALVAVSTTAAQDGHGWRITDASGNFDIPYQPGLFTYELWLDCCRGGNPDGVASAELDLVSSSPSNSVLSFTPRNGFVNAGGPTDLRLTVSGCPCGPVLVGEILMLVTEPGSLCLGPSVNGVLATSSCQGFTREVSWQGLLFGGEYCGEGATNLCGILDWPEPCCFPEGTCQPVNPIDGCPGFVPPIPCEYYDCPPIVSTVPRAWGRVKSRYR